MGRAQKRLTPAFLSCGVGHGPREAFALVLSGVEVSETVQCPFCGQRFEVSIDTSIAEQRFTIDCEVCCRPFEITAECEPGEVLRLDVS